MKLPECHVYGQAAARRPHCKRKSQGGEGSARECDSYITRQAKQAGETGSLRAFGGKLLKQTDSFCH